jgi:cob(I)alamin adenosyltransferase
MARVTTRTGDDGYTNLLGAERVPKYAPRPNAFGTLDEASSALGLARALTEVAELKELIYEQQRGLYKLMAELATTPENYDKVTFKMTADDVARLEAIADELKGRVEIGNVFIMPGDSVSGAALDLARTVIRRGERLVAKLVHDGEVQNPYALVWLNRLSDVVFIMARYADKLASNASDGSTSAS